MREKETMRERERERERKKYILRGEMGNIGERESV